MWFSTDPELFTRDGAYAPLTSWGHEGRNGQLAFTLTLDVLVP